VGDPRPDRPRDPRASENTTQHPPPRDPPNEKEEQFFFFFETGGPTEEEEKKTSLSSPAVLFSLRQSKDEEPFFRLSTFVFPPSSKPPTSSP